MARQADTLTKRAERLWEERDLAALEKLRSESASSRVPQVLYFIGLAMNALNKRRDAIECWRKACALDPRNEIVTRTLAHELVEQAPVEAAELFGHLVGLQRANADDFTCLAEIRIKQDRLGEARQWLEHALRLEPKNSLALLALATLYAQVRDPELSLDFLQRAADTQDVDLNDLASAPEFEFLWRHPRFEKIIALTQ